ncbi:hypothetical protein ACFVWF_28840 [Rhodococcus qingshengii]
MTRVSGLGILGDPVPAAHGGEHALGCGPVGFLSLGYRKEPTGEIQ